METKRTRILKAYTVDESVATLLDCVHGPLPVEIRMPLVHESQIKKVIADLIDVIDLTPNIFDIEDVNDSVNRAVNSHLASAHSPQRYRLSCRLALQYTVTAEDYPLTLNDEDGCKEP